MLKIPNHAFNEQDKKILREGISLLPTQDSEIIIARFWLNQTIEEISIVHSLSWREVDMILSSALKLLKKHCLSNKNFSLAKSSPTQPWEYSMKAA